MIKTIHDLVPDMPEDVRLAYERLKANPPKNIWGMRTVSPDEMMVKHWVQSQAGKYIQHDI